MKRRWKMGRDSTRGSVKVRERLQFTASSYLFHHPVPIGREAWPTLPCRWQRLNIAPTMPRKGNKLFTLCCALLCAKYCSFPFMMLGNLNPAPLGCPVRVWKWWATNTFTSTSQLFHLLRTRRNTGLLFAGALKSWGNCSIWISSNHVDNSCK